MALRVEASRGKTGIKTHQGACAVSAGAAGQRQAGWRRACAQDCERGEDRADEDADLLQVKPQLRQLCEPAVHIWSHHRAGAAPISSRQEQPGPLAPEGL